MSRLGLFSACLVFCGVLSAAPVPTPKPPKIEELWGKIQVPSDECLVEVSRGGELLIRGDGRPALRASEVVRATDRKEERDYALRVSRTASDDFDFRVKLSDVTPPDLEARSVLDAVETRAGVYLSGGECVVELHAWQYFGKQKGNGSDNCIRTVWLDQWVGPGSGSGSRAAKYDSNSPVYLGVSRVKGVCSYHTSTDGKKWTTYPLGAAMKFPDEVQFGVFVAHTTKQKVEAKFTLVEAPKAK